LTAPNHIHEGSNTFSCRDLSEGRKGRRKIMKRRKRKRRKNEEEEE